MLNTAAPVAAPATLPASFRKSISAVNVDGLLNTALAGQTGNVTPSMLRFSKDAAKASMGGKATPVSFTQGLVFLTCCHAWGQGKVDTLANGLPAHAAHALTTAASMLKGGAGCTAESLGAAVKHGFDAMLALPSKQATAKQGATSTPLVVPNGATVEGEAIRLADVPEMSEKEIDRRNLSADIADKRAADSIAAATAAHAAALIEAETAALAAAEAKATAEGVDVVRLITSMADQEQAVTLVRAMAARFGYTLVSVKKSLDERYNEEILAIQAEVAEEKAKKVA